MIISILGYMGCGKSYISKTLAEKIRFRIIDLDDEIIKHTAKPIPDIFRDLGELGFRKIERQILSEIIQKSNHTVLSLGGGTPIYYDNIDVITQNSRSIYLRTSVTTLSERLKSEKQKRPLISKIRNEKLPEFISKHLFERCTYYEKAEFIVDTDKKNNEEISNEIINLLGLHG